MESCAKMTTRKITELTVVDVAFGKGTVMASGSLSVDNVAENLGSSLLLFSTHFHCRRRLLNELT